jgi:hypothetical protein
MQIKTTMTYRFTATRMALIRTTDNKELISMWRNWNPHVGGVVKWYSHLEQTWNYHMTQRFHFWLYREVKTCVYVCTHIHIHMFIYTWIYIYTYSQWCQNGNNGPSFDELIKKMWHMWIYILRGELLFIHEKKQHSDYMLLRG